MASLGRDGFATGLSGFILDSKFKNVQLFRHQSNCQINFSEQDQGPGLPGPVSSILAEWVVTHEASYIHPQVRHDLPSSCLDGLEKNTCTHKRPLESQIWLIMSQFRGPRRACYLIKAYSDTIMKNKELSLAYVRFKKKEVMITIKWLFYDFCNSGVLLFL